MKDLRCLFAADIALLLTLQVIASEQMPCPVTSANKDLMPCVK